MKAEKGRSKGEQSCRRNGNALQLTRRIETTKGLNFGVEDLKQPAHLGDGSGQRHQAHPGQPSQSTRHGSCACIVWQPLSGLEAECQPRSPSSLRPLVQGEGKPSCAGRQSNLAINMPQG